MNKNEFMESLKAKLAGLNPEDREDAINYYWEYFEEAGFGEESDVTKSVGNPEDVAAKIIGASAYVNETRAEDNSTETKEEVCNTHAPCNDSEDNKPSAMGNGCEKTEASKKTSSKGGEKAVCESTALELYKDITPDAFDSIDIDVSSLDIIIRTGDEFGIYLNCKENEPIIKKEDNKLVIRDKRKSKIFDFNFNFNIFNKSKEFVEIVIPRGKNLLEVRGETDMGKLSLFAISAGYLELEADMGSVEVVGVSAPEAKIKADMGHVAVRDSEIKRFIVKSSTGAVNVNSLEAEFTDISTETGYISLEDVKSNDLRLKSETGYVKSKNVGAERITAKTDTGLVKLRKVDADYIDAASDTGSVNLQLVGSRDDYSLDLTNDLGVIVVDGFNNGRGIFNNSFREKRGSRQVTANVDTGKINVEFLGR
jgi:hypothetical protein